MTHSITVSFHGADLYIVEHEGQPFTPMKTIVESMGLDWASQFVKFKNNAQRWGIVKITIPTLGDMQEAICLPLRKLAGWLATISPNKVRPELREKIRMYQNECDDALWDYWTKGQAKREPQASPPTNTHLSLSNKVAGTIQQMFFDKLISSKALLGRTRFLVCIDNDLPPYVRELEQGEIVSTPERLPKLVNDAGFLVSTEFLAALSKACIERMARRLGNSEANAKRVHG